MFRAIRKKVSGSSRQQSQPNSHSSHSRWSFSTLGFGSTTSGTSSSEGRSSFRVLNQVVQPATSTAQLPLQTGARNIPEPASENIAGPLDPQIPKIEPSLEHEETPVLHATPRYVPYMDATPVTKMFRASNTNGGPSNFYGRVNPSLLGGLGVNEEDALADEDSIVLNDDEETEEEDGAAPAVSCQDQPVIEHPGASHEPSGASARPAFQYRAVSDDILAEFDFSADHAPGTQPHSQSAIGNMTSPETSATNSPQAPKWGYLPTAASILDDFDFTDDRNGSSSRTPPMSTPAQSQPSPPASATLSSNNPYVELLNQKDQAMTLAFLRSQETIGGRSNAGDLATDDFSFGQRYQKAADTTDVVVTRQRQPVEDLSGVRECPICAETKGVELFPIFTVSPTCTHPPATCIECLRMSIKCDLESKLWTEIRCPECREPLDYVDIQKYADEPTFSRYEALALRAAMSEAANFVWCTSGCGSGQIHETGSEQPIVSCLHCSHRSCFVHNVAWHENLSCAEYDQLIADPENFRSQIEIANDEWAAQQRAQEDADRAMAQGLEAEEQAEIAKEREEMERAKRAAALARKIAARQKKEEELSNHTVSRTTKPCPGCGWAIEKNKGCAHMTCIKCRYEFCWECNGDWVRGPHRTGCTEAS